MQTLQDAQKNLNEVKARHEKIIAGIKARIELARKTGSSTALLYAELDRAYSIAEREIVTCEALLRIVKQSETLTPKA